MLCRRLARDDLLGQNIKLRFAALGFHAVRSSSVDGADLSPAIIAPILDDFTDDYSGAWVTAITVYRFFSEDGHLVHEHPFTVGRIPQPRLDPAGLSIINIPHNFNCYFAHRLFVP